MRWDQAFVGSGDQTSPHPPQFERLASLNDAEGYQAGEDLAAAVNVAMLLGQPLLVTGEPGTGKTLLAWRIAHELGGQKPLTFVARTTSTARDLFYTYDALRRFVDAQIPEPEQGADPPLSATNAPVPGGASARSKAADPENYITYEALGQAILRAMPSAMAAGHLPPHLRPKASIRSVVLIDEIDKAPRDFPNDILNEVERMEFTVQETGRHFPDFEEWERQLVGDGMSPDDARAQVEAYEAEFRRNRPILVLTSNDEQKLPEAFLRRCVYYHIEFPDPNHDDQKVRDDNRKILRDIVTERLKGDRELGELSEKYLDEVLTRFGELRKRLHDKRPATAELVSWVRLLKRAGVTEAALQDPASGLADTPSVSVEEARQRLLDALRPSYGVLAKSPTDRKTIRRYFEGLIGVTQQGLAGDG